MTDPTVRHWQLGERSVRVAWRFSTGNMLATRDAVRAGLGIAIVPHFLVVDDVASGVIDIVLPDHALALTHATALYPNAASRSPALRALIDYLVLQLSHDD